MRRFRVIDIYNYQRTRFGMMPTGTGFPFWDQTYGANITEPDQGSFTVYDREFARRFRNFLYYDFLEADTIEDAAANFRADVLSILTFNKKRYEEMYRVFLVSDEDDPITYNYDMTETTGVQHTETTYGESQFTKGEQEDTNGEVTDSHSVAPFNSSTMTAESEDKTSQHTVTEGERTDTTAEHKDQYDADEWTLTRKGNIGVQTAGDILRIHTQYWTEQYKFMQLIFDDIAKQLLLGGDF